jgi:hypothetical protein
MKHQLIITSDGKARGWKPRMRINLPYIGIARQALTMQRDYFKNVQYDTEIDVSAVILSE